jgi:hypothetical protein
LKAVCTWWPLILALGRLRQEEWQFKTNLSYTVRSCLIKPKPKPNKKLKAFHPSHLLCKCSQILDSVASVAPELV